MNHPLTKFQKRSHPPRLYLLLHPPPFPSIHDNFTPKISKNITKNTLETTTPQLSATHALNTAFTLPLSSLSLSTPTLFFHEGFDPFLKAPSFLSIYLMACVSDESWVPLPKLLSDRLYLREDDRRDADDDQSGFFGSESTAYRLEKVFPVYALGISKPESDSVVGPASVSGDPIWDAIREEAKLEAEKEPILSSFLYASILAHDCLEQALGFVLANRLQNPTLLATQLMDIFYDVMLRDEDIQRSIHLDVQAFKDRDPACLSYCSALLYLKGYHSLQVHRVAHSLWSQGRKVLALALQILAEKAFNLHQASR
ncbi:hypothetical protein DVH24_018402 [Malus domestica]|uniref:Serine acetyltransferase N-terminal domain-containing protein n=1 Tax=Malus domestica TaxID=3750 RepID=A0A498KDD9_MALDO|nr:hypothetical protein DVH24_018402 [Malus domestica]